LRAAEQVADDHPRRCGDRKGGRELRQRDAQIADEFSGLEDVPEILQHRDRIGQQQRAHAPACRGEIPQHDEHDQERRLNGAAGEPPLPLLSRGRHCVAPAPAATPVSAMVLRISSCRSPYN
jgi:hypothetical protein